MFICVQVQSFGYLNVICLRVWLSACCHMLFDYALWRHGDLTALVYNVMIWRLVVFLRISTWCFNCSDSLDIRYILLIFSCVYLLISLFMLLKETYYFLLSGIVFLNDTTTDNNEPDNILVNWIRVFLGADWRLSVAFRSFSSNHVTGSETMLYPGEEYLQSWRRAIRVTCRGTQPVYVLLRRVFKSLCSAPMDFTNHCQDPAGTRQLCISPRSVRRCLSGAAAGRKEDSWPNQQHRHRYPFHLLCRIDE